MAFRVVAPLIAVRVDGAQGGEVYLRQGRVLPASVSREESKRLLAVGLIEEFTPEKPAEAEEPAAGSKPAGGSKPAATSSGK